jgi:hypothetical protein
MKDQEFQVFQFFNAVKDFKYTVKYSSSLHFMWIQNSFQIKGKIAPVPWILHH